MPGGASATGPTPSRVREHRFARRGNDVGVVTSVSLDDAAMQMSASSSAPQDSSFPRIHPALGQFLTPIPLRATPTIATRSGGGATSNCDGSAGLPRFGVPPAGSIRTRSSRWITDEAPGRGATPLCQKPSKTARTLHEAVSAPSALRPSTHRSALRRSTAVEARLRRWSARHAPAFPRAMPTPFRPARPRLPPSPPVPTTDRARAARRP